MNKKELIDSVITLCSQSKQEEYMMNLKKMNILK